MHPTPIPTHQLQQLLDFMNFSSFSDFPSLPDFQNFPVFPDRSIINLAGPYYRGRGGRLGENVQNCEFLPILLNLISDLFHVDPYLKSLYISYIKYKF